MMDSIDIVYKINVEVSLAYHDIREIYQQRFPELSSLVEDEMDYIETVEKLQNDFVPDNLENVLKGIVDESIIQEIVDKASSTEGRPLTDEELARVIELSQIANDLTPARILILDYIENNISSFAPNLSTIASPPIATKLITSVGSLEKLCKTKIECLGVTKPKATKDSAKTKVPLDACFVFDSALVKSAPENYRMKAAKIVSYKSYLASRVDKAGEAKKGEVGSNFKEDIEFMINKWKSLQTPANMEAHSSKSFA